tara:strand:+ start:27 stop:674 length:648 start_codon:yes stop_codon:yes gene_type:complete
MTRYNIGFLFLGAGSSSRMRGDDKLIKKINGVPQIERILIEALKLKIPIFVTIPATNIERKLIISKTNAIVIEVQDPKLGMGHSIAEGIIKITKTYDFLSLGICPSDLPDLKFSSFKKLTDYFAKTPDMICRPIKRGSTSFGHPVIFPKKYFKELKLLEGDRGGQNIIQSMEENLNAYETDDESYFSDLDTSEDFAKWYKRNRQQIKTKIKKSRG